MDYRKNRIRQAEIGIARHLIPANVDKQEFWNEHWPVIETLMTLEAVLHERIYFFQKNDHKRKDAVSLIVIADMAWQQIRILAGIKGKDSIWLKNYLPQDYDNLREIGFDSFDPDIEIVNGLGWLFDLHSALRHPDKGNMAKYPFILDEPWPPEKATHLIQVTKNLLHILCVFTGEFDESGWESDVQRKKKLAQIAKGEKPRESSCTS